MRYTIPKNQLFYTLLHVMAVITLFIIPLYLVNFKTGGDSFFIWGMYLQTLIYVVFFYLNYLWLIPRFLFKGKVWIYIILVTVAIFLLFLLLERGYGYIFQQMQQIEKFKEVLKFMQDESKRPKISPFRIHIYTHLVSSVMIMGFSIGMRMAGKLIRNEREKKELEKEKLNSELAFLKNQISPHFFFNTLNNIYSLIQINTNDAQNAVLKLSKLMRYLLYESESLDLKISKEIAFMNNYIDLMKLRLNQRVKLEVIFPEEYPDITIPPLLFIPFIENAFKHGISNRDKSFISIALEVSDEKLLFQCVNSIAPGNIETNIDKSGIGLENIRKRLMLLFGSKHQLTITKNENEYKVALSIYTNNIK